MKHIIFCYSELVRLNGAGKRKGAGATIKHEISNVCFFFFFFFDVLGPRHPEWSIVVGNPVHLLVRAETVSSNFVKTKICVFWYP